MEEKNVESYAGKIAMYGMMIALAMILSFVETLIPISLGIPGIKLGLANLVTIVCLYTMGPAGAWAVSLTRIILTGFTFGNMFSMAYSMAGGVLSLVCMMIAKKSGVLSTAGVSIIGGMTHNIGQLLVAFYVVRTAGIFWYLPVLMTAGIITGTLIGMLSAAIVKRIRPYIRKSGEQGENST